VASSGLQPLIKQTAETLRVIETRFQPAYRIGKAEKGAGLAEYQFSPM
jgi:hypothetical protein